MSGIILIRTVRRRYAVRHADTAEIRLVDGPLDLAAGPADQPYVAVELGPLLDRDDVGPLKRPRALVVPLRRRRVALLVDRIEEFVEQPQALPLPALIAGHLRQPWSAGAVLVGGEAVVLLDLRAVARTALAELAAARPA